MKNLINNWKEILIFLTIIFIVSSIRVFGDNGIRPPPIIVNPIVNPASKYCTDLGYESSLEGVSKGVCKFPDGSSANEWDFVLGKAGREWSYCSKKGYEIKTLYNTSKCVSIYSRDCAVCILKNGTEVEVTQLMSLEKIIKCGNDICETNENYNNCPADCLKPEEFETTYIIVFLLIIILIIVYVIIKKFKGREQ